MPAICGVLLATFAVLARSAAATKNATFDEPMHALSRWLELRRGDYRLDATSPSLGKRWATVGNAGATPPVRLDGSPVERALD